jgi:hypothetical protein
LYDILNDRVCLTTSQESWTTRRKGGITESRKRKLEQAHFVLYTYTKPTFDTQPTTSKASDRHGHALDQPATLDTTLGDLIDYTEPFVRALALTAQHGRRRITRGLRIRWSQRRKGCVVVPIVVGCKLRYNCCCCCCLGLGLGGAAAVSPNPDRLSRPHPSPRRAAVPPGPRQRRRWRRRRRGGALFARFGLPRCVNGFSPFAAYRP